MTITLMLFDELSRIETRIRSIDAQRNAAVFAKEMVRRNAAVLRQLAHGPEASGAEQLVLLGVAAGCIMKLLYPLPGIIKQLSAVVRNTTTPSALRCAVAGALSYLVQPHDLIPDDAPGGYGFVDDAVLLHASQAEYMRTAHDTPDNVEASEQRMRLAAAICPPEIIAPLEKALAETTLGFRVLAHLPTDVLDAATEQIIAQPFQASLPPVSPPSDEASSTLLTWSDMAPLGLRDVVGMTFDVCGETITATFPDGRHLVVSS